MKGLTALFALIIPAVLSSGCGGPTDPSDNVVETFTGTIAYVAGGTPQGSQHTFTVSNDGELFITLVTLTPALPVGKYAILALGVNSGSSCGYDQTVQNNFARPGTQLTIPARKGAFCVGIFDKGDFTAEEAYELKVSHP